MYARAQSAAGLQAGRATPASAAAAAASVPIAARATGPRPGVSSFARGVSAAAATTDGSDRAAGASRRRPHRPLNRRPLPLPPRACPDWRALQASHPPPSRELERSALVNEEVVYLIFQLELDGALQRALNLDAFEAAQQVRARREQVDLALREVAKRKVRAAAAAVAAAAAAAGGGGGGGASAADAAAASEAAAAAAAVAAELTEADVATEGLRLRTEMSRAASEERYADAARFRDQLADLERRAKQAAAAREAISSADEDGEDGGGGADPDASAASATAPLRLGQRVVHRTLGYRGVVVGWDAACCEDDDWVEAAGAAEAPGGGLRQKFYHVLVDVRDWPPDPAQPPVAYVADALLSAPERDAPGLMWDEVYGQGGVAAFGGAGGGAGDDGDEADGAFRHPYAYVLFLGQDAAGDLLPCRQLRDRYNQQRRDVWRPGAKKEEDEEDEDEDGGVGGGGGGSGSGGGGGSGPTRLPGIDMSSLM